MSRLDSEREHFDELAEAQRGGEVRAGEANVARVVETAQGDRSLTVHGRADHVGRDPEPLAPGAEHQMTRLSRRSRNLVLDSGGVVRELHDMDGGGAERGLERGI